MIRLKRLLNEQNLKPYVSTNWLGKNTWNYPAIEKCKNAKDLAAIIKKANGTFQDDEAAAEAAFMAIANYDKDVNKVKHFYDDVYMALGEDPYQYVKNFMDTSLKYHKQSIDTSFKRRREYEFDLDIDDLGLNTKITPTIVIQRHGDENIRKYKRKVREAYKAAKQWWSTYLNLPQTQLNFDANWAAEVRPANSNVKAATLSKDIFPLYIKHLSKIKLKFVDDPNYSVDAYVNTSRNDVLVVNIAKTINETTTYLKVVMTHEIQHMLFIIHPLNPGDKYENVGSETPIKTNIEFDATTRQNMEAAVKTLPGVKFSDLMLWKLNAEKEAKRDSDPEYICRDTEQGSRVEYMRSLLGVNQFKPKDFVPYITRREFDDNIWYLLYCWAQQGFPNFTQYINNLNKLVKTDSDSKKPETIKLKSLVPPQTT